MTSERIGVKAVVEVDNSRKMSAFGNAMGRDNRSHRERALSVVRARGIARARDFRAAGVPLVYLKRLMEAGALVRLGRGLYQDPEEEGRDVAHDLALASRLVPRGVVSLVSALRQHGLTTQVPAAVWMTIPHRSRIPRTDAVSLQVVRATGEVLTAGVEHVLVEGVDVSVFGVAKTVADCFKHRRLIGQDLAVEALRNALGERRTDVAELMKYARIDRVEAVVRRCIREMA